MTQIRIGFVGDSITHGTGDETLLGWTIRAGQAEASSENWIFDTSVRFF